MYVVDDETFLRARSILSSLANELTDQVESDAEGPVDLRALVRQSAQSDLPEGGEVDYLRAVADRLERTFPIEELFPRRRRAGMT